jgi:hypothetical protein
MNVRVKKATMQKAVEKEKAALFIFEEDGFFQFTKRRP